MKTQTLLILGFVVAGAGGLLLFLQQSNAEAQRALEAAQAEADRLLNPPTAIKMTPAEWDRIRTDAAKRFGTGKKSIPKPF